MVIKMKVFLSYKWEDREWANGINGLLNNPNNRYRHLTDSERQDERSKGKDAVKEYLKGIIRENNALLCLIGSDTYNATGVIYELEVAKSIGKKIIAVRIPNTTGGMPNLLKSWGISETKWNTRDINDALSR